MFRAWRQVREVMLTQRLNFILVVQDARPFHDEINFLLTLVRDGSAIALPIQRHFAETSDGLERSIVCVALTENSSIVASWRGKVRTGLGKVWNVAVQPCGINFALLCQELRREHRDQQNDPQVQSSGGFEELDDRKLGISQNSLTGIEIFRFIVISIFSFLLVCE